MFPYQRMLFALAWSGVVAWSATGLARQIPGLMKFVFLVWFLIYSNSGGVEQHAFLVMAYGCMILMGDVQRHKAAAAIFLIAFALLALVKFTLFMAATAGIVVSAFVHAGNRNVKASSTIVAGFGAVFLALWVADGQQLRNLSPWLRGSLEIAGGYTDAMTIFPKTRVLVICVVAGVLFLASLWLIIRSARLSLSGVGILVITTIYLFLSWKHGFVRADGHVMGYIFFLPLAFSILLTEAFRKSMGSTQRVCLATFFMAAVILCNWAADLQEPGTMLTKLVDWPRYMIGNSRLILNSVTGNRENCFAALRGNRQQKRVPDLPIARTVAGTAPIDVLNYSQWAALANNLNYRPRPVIQGYSAYTPYLQELNLSFFRSGNRPRYLLFKMETIDGRFPALDDAPLLPYILNNYTPVATDSEFLVLQALPGIPRDIGVTLVHEQTVAFGETLDMSAYSNKFLIMQAEVRPSIFGRAVRFLFQSPVLTLNATMNGRTASYRFIPAMAERGFVVAPILLTNNDVMRYFDGATGNRAEKFFFTKPEYAWGQLSNTITVRLYKPNSF
ncbi:MAG TPA: hypothetical protein VN642_03570 [Dongiaceae bacterium]|nr:hypothetical protein [Dongiaceae bacterium]